MNEIETIRALEERGFNAWPALRTVLSGGWVLRLSNGLSKRANSANALAPTGAFAALRETAELLYARHGLPPIFRLSPLAPPEADRALAAAGYAAFDPSRVMTRPLADHRHDPAVGLEIAACRAWLDGFAATGAIPAAQRATHDAMIQAIAQPAGFATVRLDGEPIGFGLAVCERGAVGLFDLQILPAHRGRGHGRRLTETLMAWGRAQGATIAYLQVREQNPVALGLYGSLGFRDAYRYHYRVPS